eukprot:365737-Chlamydomonas_euryale.AAC.11
MHSTAAWRHMQHEGMGEEQEHARTPKPHGGRCQMNGKGGGAQAHMQVGLEVVKLLVNLGTCDRRDHGGHLGRPAVEAVGEDCGARRIGVWHVDGLQATRPTGTRFQIGHAIT